MSTIGQTIYELSPLYKLILGVGTGILIWGFFRWLIYSVNKSFEQTQITSNKKKSKINPLRELIEP